MRTIDKAHAPAFTREDGVISNVLHTERDEVNTDLTVTWVDVDPGAAQERHSHASEQVYVVVAGTGVVSVSGERRSVEAGDLVYVPSNAEHGIENTGDRPLEYVSAATPVIERGAIEAFYEG